ncbi:MAG: hypothetical protein DHS20C05_09210 [Hyphococcus sp.]|nr:MAG: hypothetical protein DHS20C05_09210 [Marinicaulis sp.]
MAPHKAASILRLASVMFFFTALIFASGAFAPIDNVSVFLHDMLDWPLDGSINEYTREARWFSAIGGGVFASLCVLLFLVVAPLIERGDEEVRRGVIISMLVWFVVDSAGSIAAGVPANAVFNISFLAILLGPILMIRTPKGAPV